MRTLDLNADAGESHYERKIGTDAELIPELSSVNLACGFHGGDPATILRALELARAHGTEVGAHPSYRDLEGFGRRIVRVAPETLRAELRYQLGALRALAESVGLPLRHVKAHGALYHEVMKNPATGDLFLDCVLLMTPGAAVVGQAGSPFLAQARARGFRARAEVFADRRYDDPHTLVPRSKKNAVIANPQEAAAQAVALAQDPALQAEVVCVHGDEPGAAEIAAAVRRALEGAGFKIRGRTTS